MRLHEPLGPPYTKKTDFFNERILINGRRRLSKHAPRHLPPIFFFNRARFRRERADLVPFIWVLPKEATGARPPALAMPGAFAQVITKPKAAPGQEVHRGKIAAVWALALSAKWLDCGSGLGKRRNHRGASIHLLGDQIKPRAIELRCPGPRGSYHKPPPRT